MRENADRPLEAIETKMRLQASRIMHKGSLYANLRRSEPVVRGGVEPPTFRFSGGRSYQLSYLTIRGLTVPPLFPSGPDGI